MTVAVSPEAFEDETAAVDDRLDADIHDCADDLRSLAVSIREAAFRRDQIMVRILRGEFRRQAVLLLGLVRDIALRGGDLAGAAERKGGKR